MKPLAGCIRARDGELAATERRRRRTPRSERATMDRHVWCGQHTRRSARSSCLLLLMIIATTTVHRCLRYQLQLQQQRSAARAKGARGWGWRGCDRQPVRVEWAAGMASLLSPCLRSRRSPCPSPSLLGHPRRLVGTVPCFIRSCQCCACPNQAKPRFARSHPPKLTDPVHTTHTDPPSSRTGRRAPWIGGGDLGCCGCWGPRS